MSLLLLLRSGVSIPIDAGDWTIDDSVLWAPDGLDALASRDSILNTIRVTAHPKVVDVAPTTIVYNQTNAIQIPSGATKFLLGDYADPLTGDPIGATNIQGVTPGTGVMTAAGTDYIGNDLDTGGGMDRTADLTIVANIGAGGARFSVTNAGAAAWLTLLQLRGQGIYDRQAIDAEATDLASIATYGERAINLDMPYQPHVAIAQGAADYILANDSDAIPRAHTVQVVGRDAATVTHILRSDISDLVTVRETVTGFDEAFFINGIELVVMPSGHVAATFNLVRLLQGHYWVLGTSVLGLNTTPAPF